MKAIVIGCGRVGSQVAKNLAEEGWDVVAIDENEEVLNRLGETWEGGFLVGQLMKETRGKAQPQVAQEVLKQALDRRRTPAGP